MSLILIDKPEGPTSHAVVATIKRALKAEKVGHLGTLDPFASGLLPIMIGNTARLSDEAMDGKKGYLFTIGFGHETDTLDPTGRVIASAELPEQNSLKNIDKVLEQFTGLIEQVPPAYSALKFNGMPLYEYMRATGKLPMDIESKRRSVTIHSLEVTDANCEQLTLRVICSKGTYVRSLARDIARTLGSVGTCIKLRREMVEPWHVDKALKLSIDESGRIAAPDAASLLERSLPAWAVAPSLPRARLNEILEAKLLSGNPIALPENEMMWDFPPEPAESSAKSSNEAVFVVPLADVPVKIFARCNDTLFLCELTSAEHNMLKIQPRKRIQ
ncbi:tRNA pseudouridine(55) synthase TruB [bacterium]|nr:tRNA pseudouridine(55) synthase TruB [bacterium]